MVGLWGMWNTPFMAIAPRSTLVQNGRTYGLIELNCIFMLNWIVYIGTVGLGKVA